MNIPFSTTEQDIRDTFGKYGELEEISIPLGRGGQPKGICFVRFENTDGAIRSFAKFDKTYFQGRRIHIFPAQKRDKKPEFDREREGEEGQSTLYKTIK